MRLLPIAAAAFIAAILSGCIPRPAATVDGSRPDLIIVREFAFTPGAITLDPTLGYSLHRGHPGAPLSARAETVGRAAAFSLADAITQELTRLGYAVVHVEDGTDAPGGRALVVSGVFRHIYEGHRHENASVEAEAEVSFRPGGSAAESPLTTFDLDSRRLPREGLVPVSSRRGQDVDYEATRVGAAIGRYTGDLARLNRWPGAR